ncbi:MAG: hypothetical protein KGJ89_03580 [Patescibacteria group bacterium]|nr:hypothetical protein [Patescibacteria group bacterium]MDE2015372.1 hypothetical protein [Patescibacteria group bacterium]MDE2227013.1 hypothetical protein [Patescibacteria group bacterium]
MRTLPINFKILLILFIAVCGVFLRLPAANASTNISATTTDHWAWSDVIGWIDFYNTLTVTVSSTALSGYASSSAGDISLDCATTRGGNICSPSNGNYYVSNDNSGNLAGWGWNDTYGWVSFCGGQGTANCPGAVSYLTYILGNGKFEGWAWNDIVGWLSFNCNNYSDCDTNASTTQYRVTTSWQPSSTIGTLDSSTFDTGVNAGAQLNSVMWNGPTPPGGTSVKFQFASSNSSSGPWTTYIGTDGTSNTYYTPSGPNVPVRLSYTLHNNYRYFRYRVSLFSNSSSTLTPEVDDIIINWSP